MDQREFHALFAQLAPRLHGFLVRYGADPEMAGDIVQDAFVRLWHARETLDRGGNVKSYLYTAALNLLRDQWRRQKVVPQVSLDVLHGSGFETHDPSQDHHAAAGHAELESRVRQAVAALPDPMRELILLRMYSGLTFDEIAASRGEHVRTVKRRVRAALDTLADTLERHGYSREGGAAWLAILL